MSFRTLPIDEASTKTNTHVNFTNIKKPDTVSTGPRKSLEGDSQWVLSEQAPKVFRSICNESGVLQNQVGAPLRNHQYCGVDITARHIGKNRRIDDAQAIDAMDFKPFIDHRLLYIRTHRA